MGIYSAPKIIKESIPLLTILIGVEVLIGQVLNTNQSLISIPLILALVPVINGVGGNIGTILGSRLTSGLHTGMVTPDLKDANLRKDIQNSLIIASVTYLVLALIIGFLTPLFGIENIPSVLDLTMIILGAGILLVSILVIISIISAFYSFKKGIDPDNIVTPLVTTSGDILGIGCLLLLVVVVI